MPAAPCGRPSTRSGGHWGTVRWWGHDAEHLGLGDLWCDVREFWVSKDAGDHEQALELCRGEFLPGFHLNEDGAEFEKAGLLGSGHPSGMRRSPPRAHTAFRSGETLGAIQWAGKTLEFAPYDEAALRCLLEIQVEAGNRPGAVQAYRRFAHRLERDLQMSPGSETAGFVQRLQEARPAAASGEPVRMRPARTDQPPGAPEGAPRDAEAVPVSGGGLPPDRSRRATQRWPRLSLIAASVTMVVLIASLATDYLVDSATRLGVGDVVPEPAAAAAAARIGYRGAGTEITLAAAIGAGVIVSGSIHRIAYSFSVRARLTDAIAGDLTFGWSPQGLAAAARGDTAKAMKIDARLTALGSGPAALLRARIHTVLGNQDRALDLLDQALGRGQGGQLNVIGVHQDPAFRPLLGDSRFQRLIRVGPAPARPTDIGRTGPG